MEYASSKEEKLSQLYPIVYRYVYVRLGNDAEVPDIVQESLYKYLKSEIVFDDRQKEKRWILTVASNLCKNYWRSSWYKRVVPFTNDEILEGDTPQQILELNEKNKILLETVLELPAKYRDVIHLFYYEDMSVNEICEVTGGNKSTILTRLERGRKMLKSKLEGRL